METRLGLSPRKSLAGLGSVLGSFSAEFMAGGRDFHDEPDRAWGVTVHEPQAPGDYSSKS